MRALPGVAGVYPQVTSRFDVIMKISVENPLKGIVGPDEFVEETKGFLAGLPAELVQDDLRLPARRLDPAADPDALAPFTWEPGQKVPLLLSPYSYSTYRGS